MQSIKTWYGNFVLNTITSFAQKNGFACLKGEYISTAKNVMVKDHYLNLGFIKEEGKWLLDVRDFEPKTSYIKFKNESFI